MPTIISPAIIIDPFDADYALLPGPYHSAPAKLLVAVHRVAPIPGRDFHTQPPTPGEIAAAPIVGYALPPSN